MNNAILGFLTVIIVLYGPQNPILIIKAPIFGVCRPCFFKSPDQARGPASAQRLQYPLIKEYLGFLSGIYRGSIGFRV